MQDHGHVKTRFLDLHDQLLKCAQAPLEKLDLQGKPQKCYHPQNRDYSHHFAPSIILKTLMRQIFIPMKINLSARARISCFVLIVSLMENLTWVVLVFIWLVRISIRFIRFDIRFLWFSQFWCVFFLHSLETFQQPQQDLSLPVLLFHGLIVFSFPRKWGRNLNFKKVSAEKKLGKKGLRRNWEREKKEDGSLRERERRRERKYPCYCRYSWNLRRKKWRKSKISGISTNKFLRCRKWKLKKKNRKKSQESTKEGNLIKNSRKGKEETRSAKKKNKGKEGRRNGGKKENKFQGKREE